MDNMDTIKERRRYIRTETPIPINIRIKQAGTVEEIQAQSKNISATGLMVEIEKEISSDTAVELSLSPQGTPNPIHISAKVVRSEQLKGQNLFSTGLEFTKIEEDNKNTFLKFLCDTIYRLS